MDAHPFTLAGEPLEALCARALHAPRLRLLAVADLHLGKAERIARREGRLVPPYETAETLARLAELVARLRPATVICLGDSFDDDRAAEAFGSGGLDAGARAALAGLMAGRRWFWLAGNHDPAPVGLGGESRAEHRAGPLVFRHVAEPGAEGEISGHFHPKLRLRGRAMPAFLIDGRRAVLPAFGLYTGGLDIADAAFDPLFGPEALAVGLARRPLPVPRAALVQNRPANALRSSPARIRNGEGASGASGS